MPDWLIERIGALTYAPDAANGPDDRAPPLSDMAPKPYSAA